jgi:hypothetical protein
MKNWRETLHVAIFGTSLTLFLAATLFVMVGLNPKQSSFGVMPWIYAVVSLIASGILYVVSRRYQSTAG